MEHETPMNCKAVHSNVLTESGTFYDPMLKRLFPMTTTRTEAWAVWCYSVTSYSNSGRVFKTTTNTNNPINTKVQMRFFKTTTSNFC